MSLTTRRTCPADDELAAWVEGGLAPDERARLEEHLAACDECRAVVADAAAALQTFPAQRGRRRYIAAGAATAAVAAVLLLVLVRPETAPDEGTAVRTAPSAEATEDVQRIEVRAPAEDAVLVSAALRFEWAALEVGTVYQFTLSDEDGAVLWSTRTERASVEPPPEVEARLRPSTPYYWRVEALLPDLRSASSTARRFEVRGP